MCCFSHNYQYFQYHEPRILDVELNTFDFLKFWRNLYNLGIHFVVDEWSPEECLCLFKHYNHLRKRLKYIYLLICHRPSLATIMSFQEFWHLLSYVWSLPKRNHQKTRWRPFLGGLRPWPKTNCKFICALISSTLKSYRW